MKPLRVGVVGAGSMGLNHVRIYNQLANVELAGIVEVNEERASQCSQQFHVPVMGDYRQLFGQVDAVSIVVPSSLHYPITREFLKQNIHVLVEKPITVQLGEARRLIELARSRNLVLQVGHLERFNPAVTELRQRLKKPLFLQAYRMGHRTTRCLDVGVIWDLMIHDLDIMLNLVKSDIVDISAVGQSIYSPHEDLATVRLVFRNGSVASLVASRVSGHRARTLYAMEADRNYQLDMMNQTLTIFEGNGAVENIPITKAEPLRLELEHFADCIRTQSQPLVSGLDGKRALELAIQVVNRLRLVSDQDEDLIAMAG